MRNQTNEGRGCNIDIKDSGQNNSNLVNRFPETSPEAHPYGVSGSRVTRYGRHLDTQQILGLIHQLPPSPARQRFIRYFAEITIDGDEVTEITIGGEEVKEVTIDGEVVWTGGPSEPDSASDVTDVFTSPLYHHYAPAITGSDGAQEPDFPEMYAGLDPAEPNNDRHWFREDHHGLPCIEMDDGRYNVQFDSDLPEGDPDHSFAAVIWVYENDDSIQSISGWGDRDFDEDLTNFRLDGSGTIQWTGYVSGWGNSDSTVKEQEWTTVGGSYDSSEGRCYFYNHGEPDGDTSAGEFELTRTKARISGHTGSLTGYIADVVWSDGVEPASAHQDYHNLWFG